MGKNPANKTTSKLRYQPGGPQDSKRKLRMFASPTADMVQKVHEGLNFDNLEAVAEAYGHNVQEIAPYVGLSEATLYRRKKAGQLSGMESNRVYDYGNLFTIAIRVLGDEEEARIWLHRPAIALGGEIPMEYARTAPGLDAVKRLLLQLEEGVYV